VFSSDDVFEAPPGPVGELSLSDMAGAAGFAPPNPVPLGVRLVVRAVAEPEPDPCEVCWAARGG